MIIGDKSAFAIESEITRAYERLGFRALGYFVLHIGGIGYGVREPDATLLACAFDKVGFMLKNRGSFGVPFASEPNAGEIVDAFNGARYVCDPNITDYFGIPTREFSDIFSSRRCVWHWGCDEAFDDGSGILYFEVGNRVRLIANKPPKSKTDHRHDVATLRDVWLKAETFYGILEEWHKAFELEWLAAEKVSERDDGAESD